MPCGLRRLAQGFVPTKCARLIFTWKILYAPLFLVLALSLLLSPFRSLYICTLTYLLIGTAEVLDGDYCFGSVR